MAFSTRPTTVANREYRARVKAHGGPLHDGRSTGGFNICAYCGAPLSRRYVICSKSCRDALLAEFDALYPWVRNGQQ